jgi:hypothetical protein
MGEGPLFVWMNGLNVESFWAALKWVYVLGFSVYVVFALVVLTQVKQMLSTLRDRFDSVLLMVAMIHLVVAIGALLLAIMIL